MVPTTVTKDSSGKMPPGMEQAFSALTRHLDKELKSHLERVVDTLEKDMQHRLENAVEHLEAVVRKTGNRSPVELQDSHIQESVAMNDQGVQLFYRNELEQAHQYLEAATRLDPNLMEAWNNLAVVYTAMNQPEKAIQSFQKAVEINPGRADILNNQGVLALVESNSDQALSFFEEANDTTGHQINILLNLAQAHLALGHTSRAIKAWKLIVAMDPVQEEALSGLRQFYQ